MVTRIFCTVADVLARLGHDRAFLEELVEFHGLRAYAKVYGDQASHMDGDSFMEDTLCKSGEHELAQWTYRQKKKWVGDEHDIDRQEYTLRGWFELTEPCTSKLVAGSVVHNPVFVSYVGGLAAGEFFGCSESIEPEAARFRVADLDRLLNSPSDLDGAGEVTPPPEKGIEKLRSDREQNVMRVIAGMWALSKNLPDTPNGVAEKLVALFEVWRWESPAKKTMADTILNRAFRLQGAMIRKSE